MNKNYAAYLERQKRLKTLKRDKPVFKWMQGGSVPGGHYLIYGKDPEPFIPQMGVCNSIPLRHSDVVVDIGAYLGTFAIRCTRLPVKQVTAYEPTPETFKVLSLTQSANLRLVNAAVVSDDSPTANLFISAGLGLTNSIAKSFRKIGKVTVPAVNYVEAVKGASIVKIDVEGAEYDYPIIQSSLRAIILDFHKVPDWIDKAHKIMDDLTAAGFKAVVEPVFENRWSPGGSWIRDMDTEGEYSPMMQGIECCGCGMAIQATARALCPICWPKWTAKHREGYQQAEVVNG
jgi:FkbM family methyltransferase